MSFKVGKCPCEITFGLRFRKLKSWGAIGMEQRWKAVGHGTHDRGLRLYVYRGAGVRLLSL